MAQVRRLGWGQEVGGDAGGRVEARGASKLESVERGKLRQVGHHPVSQAASPGPVELFEALAMLEGAEQARLELFQLLGWKAKGKDADLQNADELCEVFVCLEGCKHPANAALVAQEQAGIQQRRRVSVPRPSDECARRQIPDSPREVREDVRENFEREASAEVESISISLLHAPSLSSLFAWCRLEKKTCFQH